MFCQGEELKVEERETVWEGWIWCVNTAGEGAWVPECFVARRGDTCTALRDYDSIELSVRRGDVLEAGEEAAGWLWCSDCEGRQGWVPASCVVKEATSG
ncbi:MAG: SH3 domain-containing protein [Actinobacteria bacterium]|nr:SH3 domain-containing protein [Actinomycetota bacterium]